MGNLGVTEDKERVGKVFDQLFFMGYWVFGFAGICLFEMLNPFVELAFGSQYLFQREIVLVLCINFFINGTRRAVLIFKESMGLFWYDRYKAVAEAALNLGISIALVTHFGVVGVFVGTFFSTVLTSVWVEPYVIYKYRLKKPISTFFIKYGVYLAVMAFVWWITELICRLFTGGPFVSLIYRGIICVTVPNLLLWVVYRKTENWKKMEGLLHHVLRKILQIRGRRQS